MTHRALIFCKPWSPFLSPTHGNAVIVDLTHREFEEMKQMEWGVTQKF